MVGLLCWRLGEAIELGWEWIHGAVFNCVSVVTDCLRNIGAILIRDGVSPVEGGCYSKQLDVIMKNYGMIILEQKSSFQSFGPTPFSIQVKKLGPRHLLKPSKLFYDNWNKNYACFIILVNRNGGYRKGDRFIY